MILKGKTVLITGGTKGIGAAAAIELAQHGANIAIVGRSDDAEAVEVREQIQKYDRSCELILADVGIPEEAVRCVEETAARLGSVDVLIHSAGGPVPGGLLEISPEDWMRAFDVHVHAVFFLCRATIPLMRERKQGAIILISSAAGVRGCPGNTCYQVVKGALPQFARALARDFADDQIRINVVAPGIIRTRFHHAMSEETREHNIANRIPLHREGTPEQVASLIRELATNDFITGEVISIDGGMTMRIC